jgi:hypothetical protein
MVSRGQSFGVVPGIKNPVGGEQILQSPGGSPYLIYQFPSAGRVWLAAVSFSMGSSGGTGSNQGYARVRIQGGQSLAICECCVVGNPSQDSNEESNPFPGLAVPSGTRIMLDVNGAATITGVVLRASGIFLGSIP